MTSSKGDSVSLLPSDPHYKSVRVAVSFSNSESRPTLLLVMNSDSLFCDENRIVVIFDVYIDNLNTETWQNLTISPKKSLGILPQSEIVSGYLSEILWQLNSIARKVFREPLAVRDCAQEVFRYPLGVNQQCPEIFREFSGIIPWHPVF